MRSCPARRSHSRSPGRRAMRAKASSAPARRSTTARPRSSSTASPASRAGRHDRAHAEGALVGPKEPAMSGLLDRMAKASRERVRAARAAVPEGRLLARAAEAPPAPPLVLGAFDGIAELKLRGPSAGGLARQGLDRDAQIAAYCDGGAAAISVLTEPDEFGGSLEHLRDAARLAAAHGRPVMRKDFLTDPYQVAEARAAGAGGVLIIVTMLSDADVSALLGAARGLGWFALFAAFAADDLEGIAALAPPAAGPPVLAGLNCRNLRTLDVDFRRFAELAPRLPAGFPAVAES